MSKLFFGGMPTKSDVDKLLAAFPWQPGEDVSYDEVEKIINVSWKENRFRSVTGAMRRRIFREKYVQIVAYGGAFHCLTADEAHSYGRAGLSRVGRAVRKQRIERGVINPDELTTEENKKQHHLTSRHLEALSDAIVRSVKEIAAPVPHSGQTLRIAK